MLKGDVTRSRSRSTSTSSSSLSRRPSTRSMYSSDTEDAHGTGSLLIPPSPLVAQRSNRPSFGSGSVSSTDEPLNSLRRENESLKRRLADLSLKITEKDREIEVLRSSKDLPKA